MSPSASIKDVPTCISRSREHAKLAEVLYETKHEWAAVCAFYSAYHLVRASFFSDPVFDDAHRLSGINSKILPEDRYVTKHSKGGTSAASFGINEIVSFLYPNIRGRYARLHIASNAVRYGRGLEAVKLPAVKADLEELTRAFKAGEIVCSLNRSA